MMNKREWMVLLSGIGLATLIMLVVKFFWTADAIQRPLEVAHQANRVEKSLLGHVSYTQYVAAGKQALSEQMALLAANVNREYTLVEHIQNGKLGFTSEATVIIHYEVTYSFGFDLKPNRFQLEATDKGIEMLLHKPRLITAPAVKFLSYEIPSKGLLVDEKGAIIQLQQNISQHAQLEAEKVANEEAVQALCEKQVIAFLHDFLIKQPNVLMVPTISVRYLQ